VYIYILYYFSFFFTLGGSLLYFSQYFNTINIFGSEAGIIFATASFLAMAFQPILGYLNDKIKKSKEILTLITLIIFITLLLMNYTTSFVGILVLYSLYTIAVFCEMPLMDTISLSTKYPFGKIRLWGSAGFALGALVAGKIIEIFGASSFLYLGATTAIITMIIIFKIPMEVKEVEEHEEKVNLKELLKNKKYMIFVVVSMLILGTNNGHSSYFGIYFHEIGGSMTLLGTTIFLMTLSEVPFMGISPWLINKKGVEFVVLLGILFLTLRWGMYFLFPNPLVISGSFLSQGASIGLFLSVANIFVRSIVKKNTLGTAITIFMAAGSLGGMFIQYISGVLIDKYSVVYIYLFYMILAFIAFGLMIINKKIKD